MALSGAGLWAARKAAMDAVSFAQGSGAGAAAAYREALGLADSNAIIQYFMQNTEVQTTSGAPDSEHEGVIF